MPERAWMLGDLDEIESAIVWYIHRWGQHLPGVWPDTAAGTPVATANMAGTVIRKNVTELRHVGWFITLPIGGRDVKVFYELDNPNAQEAAAEGHAIRVFEEVVAVADIKVGDRVFVDDPGLAELRRIMTDAGHAPRPNHHGTVDEVHPPEPGVNEETMVYIVFDSDLGPATSNCAPYPLSEVNLLDPSDDPWSEAS